MCFNVAGDVVRKSAKRSALCLACLHCIALFSRGHFCYQNQLRAQCAVVVGNMSSHSLSSRLQGLSDTYKQTLELIQRLQKLPAIPDSNSSDDRRVELASEIHQSLKEQEDALEIVRQEADDGVSFDNRRWVGGGSVTRRRDSEREQERERNAATIAKLGEDLKTARASFRRAQLQAKRNADIAKRKEREMLFAKRSADSDAVAPARRKGQEKLTQDELALNASNDVTAALRRTHDLLQGNLKQSQFAQQTLDESTAALDSLGESYGNLRDVLKASRGLASQLLRSQKSDTWYLETAMYILFATIAWLVFRRIIYGPAWYLIWLPAKWSWRLFMSTLSAVGIIGGKAAERTPVAMSMSPGLNNNGVPTMQAGRTARHMPIGNKGGGWDRPQEPYTPPEQQSIIDKIAERAQRSQDGIVPDEVGTGEVRDPPRNTKKRMMEVEVSGGNRDEL